MTPDEKAELRKPVFISKKDGDKDLVLAWVSARLTIGGVVHSIAQPGLLTDGWYLDALIDFSPEEAAGLTEVSATMRHIAELRSENARLAAEVERLKSGAPARIAHVLDDTRGFHVESLDEDTRADFLHRITNAAFDGEAPSSWHAVPPEQK